MLDVLKNKNVKATFFLIGAEAEKSSRLTKRIYREGHEIGNHTFTHPDISNIGSRFMNVELNLTELLFASQLGVKTVLFRPPYSIDQEPDTADQVRPLEITQALGYVTIGDKLDPNDWRDNPRRTAAEITQDVFDNLPPCAENDQRCGNILLLHDGGAIVPNRESVAADHRRPASAWLRTRPGLRPHRQDARRCHAAAHLHRSVGRLASICFGLLHGLSIRISCLLHWRYSDERSPGARRRAWRSSIVSVAIAVTAAPGGIHSPVAILIPAYNEEKVIERTVRAALMSQLPAFPRDRHRRWLQRQDYEVREAASSTKFRVARVLVLTKPNSGKAEALNYGLQFVTEEIFVGIDADTVIAARSRRPAGTAFLDARSRSRRRQCQSWQSREPLDALAGAGIHHQPEFRARALNALGAVSVVPGAIGAWRTMPFAPPAAITSTPLPKMATSRWPSRERLPASSTKIAPSPGPKLPSTQTASCASASVGHSASCRRYTNTRASRKGLGMGRDSQIVIFQILLPLVSPFIDIMFVFGLVTYGLTNTSIRRRANPAGLQKLVAFFVTFHGDRLHRVHHCIPARTPRSVTQKKADGCSRTYGCNGLPIVSYFRWCW